MIVILLISDESEQIGEEHNVVFSELLELVYEARVELAGPSKLINNLIFFAYFVKAGNQLITVLDGWRLF